MDVKQRRRWLEGLAATVAVGSFGGLAGSRSVFAQRNAVAEYPLRPIRLICPFAASGGVDLTARAIAQKLSETFGQPVIVDNRPGANGTIGVDFTAKAPSDGYTLTMISSSHSVNVTLQSRQPYDLMRDLVPITQATVQPYVLVVNPKSGLNSIQDVIALAKAKPGLVTYGSSGMGGFSHLAGALFGSMAGVEFTHVPYKGGAPAMADVMGGQIHMLFSTILQSHGQIAAGRLRALAVSTAKRASSTPTIPTMQEAGVAGYEVAGWYGLMAPAATPIAIVEKLNQATSRILHLPDVRARLAVDGSEPVGNTSAHFAEHIRAEISKWRKLIRELDIRAD
ncbi:MAG: tripartite tricarboxylate transporter substrate binding protein [Rhizobacter sp.]|nr:tripartite tricarboxylate transporter substrate binding protein [Burkholderiales bacterium]